MVAEVTIAERWLAVAGYEGFYLVSDFGRVRSVDRTITGSDGRVRHWPGRVLRSYTNSAGYPSLRLCRNGSSRLMRVHLLVLTAFVGPCPPGMQARHGPEGAGVARLANLVWGTPAENMADKLRDGTSNRGERHGFAKLTAAAVSECRMRATAGERMSDLAREFGVKPGTMQNALTGTNWSHVPTAPIVVRGGRGENSWNAKLTWAQVAEIRRRYANGEIQRMIAADYGVRREAIGKIVRGERWCLP
jgi:hypothetical protein